MGGTERHEGTSTPPWEWAVAFLGLALLLAMIGYMAFFALAHEGGVPVVSADQVRVERAGDGWVVRFRVRNDGAVTAASLRVVAELRQGTAVVETGEVTIDYLPAFSERQAGLILRRDPDGHDLRIVPSSYTEP